MDKGIRIAEVRPILSRCRDAGILFHLFSIVGFPEEGEAAAAHTLRFFEDNADLIDQPGNTFDIHPFGLELRTSYFEAAERLGMIIPGEALRKEFVIGLSDGWVNSRGLSHDDVARLVAQYAARLRSRLRRYHNCMLDLWPGFEEYAVLYADYYRSRPFRYRTSLPDEDDPTPFALSWNPSALTDPGKGRVRVASRWAEIRVGEESYERLGSAQSRTSREFMAEAREKVDGLIGARLLQLVLLSDGAPQRPRTAASRG
jgi:anaerobic magnesium-protoporphyrin IX monomethyl ester cyclase